jgi:hypothetical protein
VIIVAKVQLFKWLIGSYFSVLTVDCQIFGFGRMFGNNFLPNIRYGTKQEKSFLLDHSF